MAAVVLVDSHLAVPIDPGGVLHHLGPHRLWKLPIVFAVQKKKNRKSPLNVFCCEPKREARMSFFKRSSHCGRWKSIFFLCSNRLHLRWINELTPARKGLPPTSRPFRWIPLPHHSPSLNPVRFRLDLLFVLISNWRTASCTLIEFDSVVMKTQFNLRLVQIFKFRNLHYV